MVAGAATATGSICQGQPVVRLAQPGIQAGPRRLWIKTARAAQMRYQQAPILLTHRFALNVGQRDHFSYS